MNPEYPPQPQQDPGYPPSNPAGYPPQQQPDGYPPQQGYGYPPQQGYTPPSQLQQGYPPQQQGYPQQFLNDAPPPYSAEQPQPVQPQAVQQQSTATNVVVVTQQPAASSVVTVPSRVSDNFLTLSVVLTIMCLICGLTGLLCTIPALVLALKAREAERRGDTESQQCSCCIALVLNIGACAGWIINIFVCIVIIYTVPVRDR